MSTNFYSDVLTQEDETRGFIKAYIANSDSFSSVHGSIVLAVVCRISEGDVIVKLQSPDGEIQYSHKKYGSYPKVPALDDSWLQVSIAMPSAESVMHSIQSGSERMAPLFRDVDIALPVIEMRCPKCQHKFQKNIYLIPIDTLQICPECGKKESISSFNAYEM